MQLAISTRIIDGIVIVDCSGRLVFGEESGLLRETVKRLLAAHTLFVINLRDVIYIDSGGLGTLITLYASARAIGGDVRLAGLSSRTLQLLQITKLVTVFNVHKDEQEAVLSFARGAGA